MESPRASSSSRRREIGCERREIGCERRESSARSPESPEKARKAPARARALAAIHRRGQRVLWGSTNREQGATSNSCEGLRKSEQVQTALVGIVWRQQHKNRPTSDQQATMGNAWRCNWQRQWQQCSNSPVPITARGTREKKRGYAVAMAMSRVTRHRVPNDGWYAW